MLVERTRKVATLPQGSTALTKHTMNGRSMPLARHIVLEEYEEGLYLFRYADDWRFAGDTWHMHLEDLLQQVDYEFGVSDLEWTVITEAEWIALTK